MIIKDEMEKVCMIFKRKVYDKLLEWKKLSAGKCREISY